MNIIPSVNGIVLKTDSIVKFPSSFSIKSHYKYTDKLFINRLEKLGYNKDDKSTFLIHYYKKNLEEEAYEMDISEEKVHIYASNEKGYYYGLVTLYQLIVLGKGKIPSGMVTDKPEFKVRSMMIDCVRHFVSLEELKKIISQCSLLKMNRVTLHLSDDQGYRIESKAFPKLNEIGSLRHLASNDPVIDNNHYKANDLYGGYYSQEELKDLIEYAKERKIEIVPAIDLPGHASAILASYNEFTCSGLPLKVKNQAGIFKRVFCVGNSDVYPFIYQLLDEICEIFPSPYIHLGGDEVPSMEWQNCKKCQKIIKKNKFSDMHQLQTYFMNKIVNYLILKGKTPIVFNDSLKGGKLNDECIIQYWSEMNQKESLSIKEALKGRKFILSNSNNFYFDYSYFDIPLRSVVSFEPEIRDYKLEDGNVLGMEGMLWSEWIINNKELETKINPRILALAECGWSKNKDVNHFKENVTAFVNCPELNLLDYTPLDKADIAGEEGIRGILTSMMALGARYREKSAEEDSDNVTMVTASDSDMDEEERTKNFFYEKMKYAYSKEEIEKAINIILKK